jgi:hypothetical protein
MAEAALYMELAHEAAEGSVLRDAFRYLSSVEAEPRLEGRRMKKRGTIHSSALSTPTGGDEENPSQQEAARQHVALRVCLRDLGLVSLLLPAGCPDEAVRALEEGRARVASIPGPPTPPSSSTSASSSTSSSSSSSITRLRSSSNEFSSPSALNQETAAHRIEQLERIVDSLLQRLTYER